MQFICNNFFFVRAIKQITAHYLFLCNFVLQWIHYQPRVGLICGFFQVYQEKTVTFLWADNFKLKYQLEFPHYRNTVNVPDERQVRQNFFFFFFLLILTLNQSVNSYFENKHQTPLSQLKTANCWYKFPVTFSTTLSHSNISWLMSW